MALTANEILNRVAVEVGLRTDTNPWSDNQQHFEQMRNLLQLSGEELALVFPWEFAVKEHQITTSGSDSGNYPLPDDFLYMLNQTGWERSENVPLFGPLSAQDWTYLLGRDLVSYTIYATFRLKQGEFSIFPQPPPDGLDINFEYQSDAWVDTTGDGQPDTNTISGGSDVILYDRTLITRLLKLKWLEAKGFDTQKPQADFNQIFDSVAGRDKAAEILSAGRNSRLFPYLDARYNAPDTGYGVL
jgi:hypothetical protein